MKEQLAGYFARRDVDGAKAYFLERQKGAPGRFDGGVGCDGRTPALHAGDRNGGNGADTLRDEPFRTRKSFQRADADVDRLDQIVYRYRNGLQKKEDAVFLKEQGITDTALLIALRIPGDDARARRN